MSNNIRSKTYMQVAARERSHKAQILQVALGLLVLLSILLWNQLASNGNTASEGNLDTASATPVVTVVEYGEFLN